MQPFAPLSPAQLFEIFESLPPRAGNHQVGLERSPTGDRGFEHQTEPGWSQDVRRSRARRTERPNVRAARHRADAPDHRTRCATREPGRRCVFRPSRSPKPAHGDRRDRSSRSERSEALACKLEYLVDPQDPSRRILGRRALGRDAEREVWSFHRLRQATNYVRNTHRQAATRALRRQPRLLIELAELLQQEMIATAPRGAASPSA